MTAQAELPLVSVLVPLYNHEKFIERCLESIVSDDYPNKEVIILDDGSRDDSVRVVGDWHRANLARCPERFTIRTRPNQGISKTLNELISLAGGQYLCFVSSDDFLWPGGVSARCAYLRQHPDRLGVLGDCAVVDGEGRVTVESVIEGYYRGRKAIFADERLFSYEMIFNWSIAGPAFLADRRAFELVGGYDETLLVEDWDMYLRLAGKGGLGFVDSCVAAYRVHGDNMILNQERRVAQLRSLRKTAWNNAWSFTGIRRYRLLSHFFRQTYDVDRSEGRKRYLCRLLAKTLQRGTERMYRRLLKRHGF